MTDRELRGLADALDRRGLGTPAHLLLAAHRPLRPLLDDLATALTPLLAPFGGGRVASLRDALRSDAGYDELLDALGAPHETTDARDR